MLQPFANDFSIRQNLDQVTKLPPDRRHDMIRNLMQKIHQNKDAKKELENWQMKFETNVVQTKAKWLKTVPVIFGEVINR